MTTREEFEEMVEAVERNGAAREWAESHFIPRVMDAWDAQAAEVVRLRAEVEKLRKNAWHHPACRACAANRVYQPGMTDEQVRAGLEKLCGQRFDDEVWDVASAWRYGIQHMSDILKNRGLPLEDIPHVEPTGVPLTAENAARARVVEDEDGGLWSTVDYETWETMTGARKGFAYLVANRATVLAWKP